MVGDTVRVEATRIHTFKGRVREPYLGTFVSEHIDT